MMFTQNCMSVNFVDSHFFTLTAGDRVKRLLQRVNTTVQFIHATVNAPERSAAQQLHLYEFFAVSLNVRFLEGRREKIINRGRARCTRTKHGYKYEPSTFS